ncbi:MAG: PspC domain-containing protein [Candidatus Paceibacteria bacterium]
MSKKIYRIKDEAVVAGVIAALARLCDQDPVLFRIVAITFLILTGVFPGVFIYLAAWFIILRQSRPADYTIE